MDKFEQLYADVVCAFVEAHNTAVVVRPDRLGSGRLFLDYNEDDVGLYEEFYEWLKERGYLGESCFQGRYSIRLPQIGDSFDRNFAGLKAAKEVLKKFEGFEVLGWICWWTIEGVQ